MILCASEIKILSFCLSVKIWSWQLQMPHTILLRKSVHFDQNIKCLECKGAIFLSYNFYTVNIGLWIEQAVVNKRLSWHVRWMNEYIKILPTKKYPNKKTHESVRMFDVTFAACLIEWLISSKQCIEVLTKIECETSRVQMYLHCC